MRSGRRSAQAGIRRVPLSEATVALFNGLAPSREENRARRASVLDLVGKADFAKQRLAPVRVPGLRATRVAERDVAHLPSHVRVVGTRQGRTWQGSRSADGAHERGRHVERLHAGSGRFTTLGGGSRRKRIVHDCSLPAGSDGANSLKNWLLGLDSNQQPSG